MKYQRPEIIVPETNERHQHLLSHFHLPPTRLQAIFQAFEEKLSQGVGPQKGQEIECIQTGIHQLPTRKEQGEFYALVVSETDICAQRLHLNRGEIRLGEITSANFIHNQKAIDVRQPEFTATIFAAAAIEAIQSLINPSDKRTDSTVSFVMASSITLELSTLESAFFRKFHEFCPCYNEDPMEGTDLISLLNISLERKEVNAKIIGACSNATALVMAASYEGPKSMPRCLMGIDIGSQIGAVFVQPNLKEFGLGSEEQGLLEMDVARFNGNKVGGCESNYSTQVCLPLCSVDFEVDYSANPKLFGTKSLQRMVSLKYIPEVCRLAVIQAFQGATPDSVWVQHSLPSRGTLAILADGPSHEITAEALDRYWDWKATPEQVDLVHQLVTATFSRSAAITAIVIASIAKRTGRLQPALGGVTTGMSGKLATNKFYQNLVRSHLDSIFGRNTTELIQFLDVDDAPAKGAAVMSSMIKSNQV